MLVIVNADDLGGSEEINNEVFELMASGLVTSATIMANAPAFRQAAQRLQNFPNASFGVHLNLTAFAPIGGSSGLERILDENGHLSKELFRTAIDGSLQNALLRELTLQVERALRAGVPVSHFDSHHHVHTIPKLFPVLKSLQRRFGVRKVRSTINLLPPGQKLSGLRSLKKGLFRLGLRHYYATKSPEGLGDFCDFYTAFRSGNMPRFQSLELMVHPGTTNPGYIAEVDCLRSDWLGSLPPGFQLGSYHSM
jgi:predicted glycoside hydrolase/deacetylase ChbG (UPF0249 family)